MLAPELHQPLWDMADFTACPYSKREVVNAGKALAGDIKYDPDRLDEARQIFRIAHSWRESNVYPMRRVRAELAGKIRSAGAQSITAARLKRIISIRKKLRTTWFTLYQMQDIGGCRAIVNDHDDLEKLLKPYLSGDSHHTIIRDDDHIGAPQATGYRSRHLILKFVDPDGEQGFNRHFIEVQFRTRKQHSWATAVEAVGLVRGEDLKGGNGDADWLRLFQLMAGEMADDEETSPVPYVSSSQSERRRELVDLNGRLNALQTLDSYNRAIKHTENYYRFTAPYYLIQYDIAKKEVKVRPFRAASTGSEQYASAERDSNINTVLVEVDKVADLREAYPNYFLDVGAFTDRLRRALIDARQRRINDWLTNWIENSRGGAG
jgi:hypothetical protein